MRKVTFGAANSLDNYIAREDGGVDWLLWNDDAARIVGEYWKTIDTILMGRKTYDHALKYGGGANLYRGMKTYVFSRTLKPGPADGVEIVSEDAAEFVRRLKRRKGKGICVLGGGELGRALFEADLIDEVGANIHP
ncbi:MAG TPA: dihydrofolate reductase family protein, partial [Pyrinomonadaceae bacterium]|nr:dihydrofolate reductase family protein [Pyrinomonadaceae bacterium]